jgi:hypothetical protein
MAEAKAGSIFTILRFIAANSFERLEGGLFFSEAIQPINF